MDGLLEKIRRFRAERDWDQFHSPKNLAMALMVETAELAEHFQWLSQQQSRELPEPKRREIKEELGDVFIYLLNLADKLDIDLREAAHEKIEINSRKYPAERVRGKSWKYNEYEACSSEDGGPS